MRYWYDTEFHEDGETIDLISIGIVAEDGREYYAVNKDARWGLIQEHAWLMENVIPHLPSVTVIEGLGIGGGVWLPDFKHPDMRSHRTITREVLDFCDLNQYGKPEFWGYYSSYDHVALCQLFGRMIDLPKGWPMYTRDIKQLADMLQDCPLPEQGKGEHNALADARWNKLAWEHLKSVASHAPFLHSLYL